MRRLIPTFLVLVACIVAFVYAKQQNFFKEEESKPKPLITFDVTKVVRLAITDGQNVVQMARPATNTMWVFEKPEPYPVNADMLGYWLDDYTRLETVGDVQDSDDDLGQFGLQNPTASFVVEMADGVKHSLLLGDVLPIGTTMYAKWAEEPGVFKIGPKDVQRLQKSALDFVDRQPIRVKFDRVKRMTFDWRGIRWELVKTKDAESIFDTKWSVNGGAEINYMTAADIMDKLAFMKSEQPLVPLPQLPDAETYDLTYTIEQEATDNVSGFVRTFVGIDAEDGTVRVREQNGAYWYILQPEMLKLAAEQPFQQ